MAGPSRLDGLTVDVRDVGVRYSLRLTRRTTLKQSLAAMFRRREGPRSFWALRGVNFRLVHGEALAVIGPNGAGKSTLLQALAGIIRPSEGEIEVRGTVASLLTLGAGFDQEVTGRENIYLAGAFMGMSHRDIEAQVEGIIDFADIGQFIDAPLKTYSTGMRARLGFAVATAVDPDVLLIDEVLGTGDQEFRAKSRARILGLARAAKAIVLVTHDMEWVTEICNRALLLEEGHVVAEGEPASVVAIHEEHSARPHAPRGADITRPLPAA